MEINMSRVAEQLVTSHIQPRVLDFGDWDMVSRHETTRIPDGDDERGIAYDCKVVFTKSVPDSEFDPAMILDRPSEYRTFRVVFGSFGAHIEERITR